MVRINSLISRAGGRFLMSSAVMVETPGACKFCLAAATTMVSSARSFLSAELVFSSVVVSVCYVALAIADVSPNPMIVAKE
ncbi:hypothetical protein SYMBAF_14220 [Serratia symbiotica]|uniref:Uncharacterized protein n=1 Tax=Serratia symbiotica TaxID=138074 RepID=A0A7D5SMC6_9GAMM|nr:hypothetical protein SYMBAF_14220 [Serratia symbiotica]